MNPTAEAECKVEAGLVELVCDISENRTESFKLWSLFEGEEPETALIEEEEEVIKTVAEAFILQKLTAAVTTATHGQRLLTVEKKPKFRYLKAKISRFESAKTFMVFGFFVFSSQTDQVCVGLSVFFCFFRKEGWFL